jgi:nucleoprotein TPR
LRSERDKLLAEKESWSRSSGGDVSDAAGKAQVETEKAGLTKALDEANERLKVCERAVPVLIFLHSVVICIGCRGAREQGGR